MSIPSEVSHLAMPICRLISLPKGKTGRHKRVSNPGPLEPESYALPLRHFGSAMERIKIDPTYMYRRVHITLNGNHTFINKQIYGTINYSDMVSVSHPFYWGAKSPPFMNLNRQLQHEILNRLRAFVVYVIHR